MDVIATGLPRSGLTVVAALIDRLPNAVCLNAPPWQMTQANKLTSILPYAKWLVGDFAWTRRQLLRLEPVDDFRAADGSPLMDGLHDPRQPASEDGKAKSVRFTHPGLQPGFILGMKHHALYTALLSALAEFDHFKIVAVIRHPLDVLASWRRMEGRAIAEGKLPAAALHFWPEAARIAESKSGPLERMVQLYDAHLERYHELRDKIHIVKYEDVIDDPLLIGKLFGIDVLPDSAARIERRPRVHISSDADDLRGRFEKYSVFTKYYYPNL